MLSAVFVGIEHDTKMLSGISSKAKLSLVRRERVKPGDGDDDDDNATNMVAGNMSDNASDGDNSTDTATPAPSPPTPAPPCVPSDATNWCREDQSNAMQGDVPANQFAARVRVGACDNFREGSSERLPGEGRSRFTPASLTTNGDQFTQDECWEQCEKDDACYQANYVENTTGKHCVLGLQSSDDSVNSTCEGTDTNCQQACFAREGFGHNLTFDVEAGWCPSQSWRQGWKVWDDSSNTNYGDQMKQCHDQPNIEECSHWGAEFDLSKEGCWGKCTKNEHCRQAVYEDKQGSWACYIGLLDVDVSAGTPMVSRCSGCNDFCYGKHGINRV